MTFHKVMPAAGKSAQEKCFYARRNKVLPGRKQREPGPETGFVAVLLYRLRLIFLLL
jgi:hypothetical protein